MLDHTVTHTATDTLTHIRYRPMPTGRREAPLDAGPPPDSPASPLLETHIHAMHRIRKKRAASELRDVVLEHAK